MPRQKNYDEGIVAEKAMRLFWSKGYTNTSARMLEKSMGINLFSIYSSFTNKEGVLLASVTCYKNLIRKEILHQLSQGPQTLDALKQFFYEYLHFTKEENQFKGCLLINTVNELGSNMKPEVADEIAGFSAEILQVFTKILSTEKDKDTQLIEKQANYLFLALQGMVLTAKTNELAMIHNYIELTFLGN